ncbi:MAG: hypothetical protein WBP44_15635 [Gammaproteobacteria bacterium]
MLYSLKKYSAFFLGPLAAVFFVAAVFRGAYLFQNIDSLARVSEAFVGLSQCLVALAPAAAMMFIIGLPVFYLLRWIIHWKLWSCVLGALLVVGSVSLLTESLTCTDLVAGQWLLAILIASISYGTVFWFLMAKYWENGEEG